MRFRKRVAFGVLGLFVLNYFSVRHMTHEHGAAIVLAVLAAIALVWSLRELKP